MTRQSVYRVRIASLIVVWAYRIPLIVLVLLPLCLVRVAVMVIRAASEAMEEGLARTAAIVGSRIPVSHLIEFESYCENKSERMREEMLDVLRRDQRMEM